VTFPFKLGLFFHPEDEGSTFLGKAGKDQRDYVHSITSLVTAERNDLVSQTQSTTAVGKVSLACE
jgi:hypothetical protein